MTIMETREYKWTLRHGGKKLRCPQCGQLRFVPYVAVADRRTMAGEQYGRCDREQSCGYHRYPGKDVSTEGITPRPLPIERPLRFQPSAVRTDIRTPLFEWAAGLIGLSKAVEAWVKYRVGSDGGRAVFWEIAKDGSIRGGKSIPYKSDGHRDKSDPRPASWLHKSPAWNLTYTGEKLEQCFFGEHLLARYPKAKVAIVESEKTAIIMSALSRGYIWLASGGSQGLKNEERLKALYGRDVVLVPDHGQYYAWKTIAYRHGWQIDDKVERHPIFEGCDILDIVEDGIRRKK